MTAPGTGRSLLADDGPAGRLRPAGEQDPADQPSGTMRASDADRERTVDTLGQAFAEGRLTAEEHAVRVERAYGARTYAELLAVSADLPTGPTAARRAGGAPDRRAAPPGRRTSPLAVAALVCSVIPGLPQLAAIILGVAALRQIRRTGERGTALAGAALTLAILGPVLAVLLIF
jgi:hypothetical protein